MSFGGIASSRENPVWLSRKELKIEALLAEQDARGDINFGLSHEFGSLLLFLGRGSGEGLEKCGAVRLKISSKDYLNLLSNLYWSTGFIIFQEAGDIAKTFVLYIEV